MNGAFVSALLDPSLPVPEGLSDGAARPAGRRFDVYRNNVAVALGDALLAGFPLVTRLLGQENMKGLAGIFLRAHPPDSPVMQRYGEEFPAFLGRMPQLAHLGYLPDAARLDLALRQAYHAADAAPLASETLAARPPDVLMRTRVELAPAVRLLRSGWPLHGIWRFNMEPGTPAPQPGAQDILITRPGFDPAPHLLPAGGAAWAGALMHGATIGAAYDAALAEAPGFDPSASLALLFQGNAITSLDPKDASQ